MTRPATPGVAIRPATAGDLPLMQEIERAAGRVFAEVGMEPIAEDEPPTLDELSGYQREGRAWVAADHDDLPVAYLIADLVDGNTHIEQVSVHPHHSRRGIGKLLIDHVARWSAQRGLEALTLTTFGEVQWNAPYYERCGFRRLSDDELTPGLRAIRARERAHGLDRWPRCCMRREV